MTAELRTWTRARGMHTFWDQHEAGWIPFGYARQPCGCLVDTFTASAVREPCLAHEGDGHVCVISEQDGGMNVARCLVLVCGWRTTHYWEGQAVEAAQDHWRDTRTQPEPVAAGSN